MITAYSDDHNPPCRGDLDADSEVRATAADRLLPAASVRAVHPDRVQLVGGFVCQNRCVRSHFQKVVLKYQEKKLHFFKYFFIMVL